MNILEVLVRVLAPIISFTCDEVWEHFPPAMRNNKNRPFSIQLGGWPTREDFAPALPQDEGAASIESFACAMGVREVVTKALEQARADKLVNKSQEAAVKVIAPKGLLEVLSRYDDAVFEELFIVSGVEFAEGDELSCEIMQAQGEKCPRCWNYRDLGGNAGHPHVCKRCGDVLDEIGFVEA
ncbi:MAG: class I tRNA ligase family protein, partial [Eggerthellaceae bacterium]|nr:class I tRNA ligase family protein [Eggerthellaceae bacterium]